MRPRQSSFWKVFSIPLAIGLVSLMGLFSALLGDGAWDVLSRGYASPAVRCFLVWGGSMALGVRVCSWARLFFCHAKLRTRC